MILTRVKQATSEFIKVLRYGKNDVQTADQISPFGIDSNPLKDMIAIYSPTISKGDTVILGYINRNQLAGIGETRLFSEDGNGDLSTYLWLRNNGIIEVGGDTDFMVRYSELETAFNQLKDDFDNHVHDGVIISVSGGSGAPAVGVTGNSGSPTATTSADISGAKINEIKTI